VREETLAGAATLGAEGCESPFLPVHSFYEWTPHSQEWVSWATRTRDHGDVAMGVIFHLGWKGRNPALKQTVRGLKEWVTS